jgi:hypothetical protein
MIYIFLNGSFLLNNVSMACGKADYPLVLLGMFFPSENGRSAASVSVAVVGLQASLVRDELIKFNYVSILAVAGWPTGHL